MMLPMAISPPRRSVSVTTPVKWPFMRAMRWSSRKWKAQRQLLELTGCRVAQETRSGAALNAGSIILTAEGRRQRSIAAGRWRRR